MKHFFCRFRRRIEFDESGSAHVEWVMAVAFVVIMAVPVMALIGKGSELHSDQIAISITEGSEPAGDTGAPAGREPAPVVGLDGLPDTAQPPAADDDPGEDLGVGYDAVADFRTGAYRPIQTLRNPALASVLEDLRRDKPAAPVRRPGNSSRVPAADSQIPATAGVSLPRLPVSQVGFADASSCPAPLDEGSIADARYERIEVVSSGR